jgi:hypothetical protein
MVVSSIVKFSFYLSELYYGEDAALILRFQVGDM